MPLYSDYPSNSPSDTGVVPYLSGKSSDGTIVFPDGTTLTSTGYMRYPDGTIHTADVRGCFILPDGSLLQKDMSIIFPDGSGVLPDGSIFEGDDANQPVTTGSTQMITALPVRGQPSSVVRSVIPFGTLPSRGTTNLNDGVVKLPNNMMRHPDGSIEIPWVQCWRLPDGSVLLPNGMPSIPDALNNHRLPDGSVLTADNTLLFVDGRIVKSDGSQVIPGMGSEKPKENTPKGVVTLRNGMLRHPDGNLELPSSGVFILADGTVQRTDGVFLVPEADGSYTLPSRAVLRADRSILFPDGAVLRTDGAVIMPDGTILDKNTGTWHIPPVGAVYDNAEYSPKAPVDPNLLALSQALPDGSVLFPNGMTQLRDGRVKLPDGSIKFYDGRVLAPDGKFRESQPDGKFALGDGSKLCTDGSLAYPDGSVKLLDNSVVAQDGSIEFPDGSKAPAGTPLPSYDVPVFPLGPRIPIGSVPLPNGSYRLPNGCIQYFSGAVKLPNGLYRIPDGRVVTPNGTPAQYQGGGAVAISKEAVLLPDLTIRYKDGSVKQVDGCVRLVGDQEGNVRLSNGQIRPAPFSLPTFPMPLECRKADEELERKYSEGLNLLYPGCFVLPNGVLRVPDGTFVVPSFIHGPSTRVALPSGNLWYANGVIMQADGTIIPPRNLQRSGLGADETQTLGLLLTKLPPNSPQYNLCVEHCDPNGPADKAGIARGDLLMFWNSNELTSMEEFLSHLRSSEVGDIVKLFIQRHNQRIVVPVIIASRKISGAGTGTYYSPPTSPSVPTVGMRIQQDVRSSAVIVRQVIAGGPAERVGILPGDILVAWNEFPINSAEMFAAQVCNARIGEQIMFKISRQGQIGQVPLTVEARPSGAMSPTHGPIYASPPMSPLGGPSAAGFSSGPPTTGLRIQQDSSGVAINEVVPGGPGERLGLLPGDVIESWNGAPVSTCEVFVAYVRSSHIGERVLLRIRRGSNIADVALVIEPRAATYP